MAHAGRGQPVNTLITNNVTNQVLGLVEQGDVAVTLEGVTCFATLAGLETGILNQTMQDVRAGVDWGPPTGPGSGATGVVAYGTLTITLDPVTSTIVAVDANFAGGSNIPSVGHGGGGLFGAQRPHGIFIPHHAHGAAPPPTASTTSTSYILLESGDQLLNETGDPLILEANNDL